MGKIEINNLNHFQKLGLVFTCLLLVAVAVAQSRTPAESYAQSYSDLESQAVVCYHKMFDGSGLAECGDAGCLYPNKTYCTNSGCFNSNNQPSDGAVIPPGFPTDGPPFEEICLNADGSVRGDGGMPYMDDDDFQCDDHYDPVCGKDGSTYQNDCHAKEYGHTDIGYYGECGGATDKCSSQMQNLLGVDCHAMSAGWFNGDMTQYVKYNSEQVRFCADSWLEGCSIGEVTICPSEWDPICGKNGKEYRNQCDFDKYGAGVTTIDYRGSCKKNNPVDPPEPVNPVECSWDYDPVCGNNGMTHYNRCYLDQAGMSLREYGVCQEAWATDCFQNYDPVCGLNGKTFRNVCEAHKVGMIVDYNGSCPGDPIDPPQPVIDCPKTYEPVCSIDNVTYNNECQLQQARMQLGYYGECNGGNNNNVQDLENAKQHLKQSRRDIKNRERELRDNFRNSDVDTGAATRALEKWSKVLDSMDPYVSGSSLNGKFWIVQQNEEQNARFAADDTFAQLYKKNEGFERKRVVEEKRNFLKDKEREVKNHKRENHNTIVMEKILTNIKACIATMERITDNQDFWDKNSDCDYLDGEFWDENNRLWEEGNKIRQKEDSKNILTDKSRMLKDMERECKRNSCSASGNDVIKRLYGFLQTMNKAAGAGDFDTFWDANSDFDFESQDFWDSMHATFERQDLNRWMKDLRRELKDRARWMNDLERDNAGVAKKAKAILAKMEKAITTAEGQLNQGEFEDARETLQYDLEDIRFEFDDAMEAVHRAQEEQFRMGNLEHMTREIEQAERTINEHLENGIMEATRAQRCLGYVSEGKELLRAMKGAISSGDRNLADSLQWDMESLGTRADHDCADVMDRRPDFDGFNTVYIEKRVQHISEKIFERVSEKLEDRIVNKIMERLGAHSNLFNDMLENAGGDFEEEIAATLEATTLVPDRHQEEFLRRKSTMLEKIKELEAQVAYLQAENTRLNERVLAVSERIASYNFMGPAGSEMEERIAEFVARADGLSESEIQIEIEELEEETEAKIEEARDYKYEIGAIPFLDADGEWFSVHAANLKQTKIMTGDGDGSHMAPARNTNVAELVTLFGRVVEKNGNSAGIVIQNGRTTDSLPEWSHKGAGALEARGVDLDSLFAGKIAGDSVSRVDVARLMQLVFNLKDGDAGFADIDLASSAGRAAIGAVNAAGIMTGEGDGTYFNVKGALNRAAMAKVLNKALELQQ